MNVFGPFRFDDENQLLYRGATPVRLTPKATHILEVLTKRPNELISHDELLDKVWPGVHVQPEVLKVYIAELRRALKDSAERPRYIETVHRRGYRFLTGQGGDRAIRAVNRPIEKLVGRSGELALLDKLLRRAARGERQVVFVTGEPGMGKSTLLAAFTNRVIARQGICCSLGQVAHDGEEGEPFSPVLDALGKLLAGKFRESLISALRRAAPGWLVQFPAVLEPGESPRLRRELSDATSQRMSREFADAMELFAQDFTTVLALDDIDQAGPSTVNLLEFFASRTGSARVLLIAASEVHTAPDRVRSVVAGLEAREQCVSIPLPRLSEDDVRRFLERRFPSSGVADALSRPIHEVSGGVPLFLSSMVNYVEEKGWVLKTGNGWIRSAEALSLPEFIPPDIRELVEMRIRELGSEDQRVLEAASIAGVSFPSILVSNALKQSAEEVEDACNRIVREGSWLEFAGFSTQAFQHTVPLFRFLHEVFREAFYGRQSPAERVQRHGRIALALEQNSDNQRPASAHCLARHFFAARQLMSGIQYLREAAKEAKLRYAGGEATALLLKACEIASHLEPDQKLAAQMDLFDELGGAYYATGELTNASVAWHKALTVAMKSGETSRVVHALSRLAFPMIWDKLSRLRLASESVLTRASAIQDPVLRAELTLRAIALSDISGGDRTDYEKAEAALRQITAAGDPLKTASALIAGAGLRVNRSHYSDVIDGMEESLRLVLKHDMADVVRGRWWFSWALFHAGQWGRSQAIARVSIEHAQKSGNSQIEALFTTLMAWLHLESGAYDSAQSLCGRALELQGDTGFSVATTFSMVVNAMAAVGRQDTDAITLSEAARTASHRTGVLWQLLAEMSSLQAYRAQHKPDEVRASVERLLELAEKAEEKTWKAVALSTCATVEAENNHTRAAQDHIRLSLELISSNDLPLAKWRVEAAAADVLADRSESETFRARSAKSRMILFNSLATTDPLSPLAGRDTAQSAPGQTGSSTD